MSAVTRTPAKAHLEELRESIKRSPTRRSALMRISKERGISVDALRMAAKRAGLVSPDHSLKYAFSEMEEKGLVLTCLLYARQCTPLSIPSFIELASFFAKREKGHYFSYHFAHSFC